MFHRTLSKRTLWLRHCADVAELIREYPQLKQIGSKGKIPDPWDDYMRSDWGHKCWKRHRKTQYREKRPERARIERPKVVYDTYWCVKAYWVWSRNENGELVKERYIPRRCGEPKRFRVREAYRRHKMP